MNGALLAGGLVVAYLVFKGGGGLGGLFGPTVPARAAAAHGTGIPPNGGIPTEAAIGGAIGAGACVAGGAALGAPQAGAALAGVCGAIGAQLAPHVVEGAKFLGRETAAGGAFVGREVSAGATAAFHEVGSVVRSPGRLLDLQVAPLKIADRAITQSYGNLPVSAKIVAAPVVYPTKVAVEVVTKATSAASAVLNKINPFSSGINCSVAQQPANAADCRRRYGMTSAPGSDAWAREHGQTPILTGPGST